MLAPAKPAGAAAEVLAPAEPAAAADALAPEGPAEPQAPAPEEPAPISPQEAETIAQLVAKKWKPDLTSDTRKKFTSRCYHAVLDFFKPTLGHDRLGYISEPKAI